MDDEEKPTGFAAVDARAQEAGASDPAPLALPSPEAPPEPTPKQILAAKMLIAREKAATGKKRLMLDEVADALIEAIDAAAEFAETLR